MNLRCFIALEIPESARKTIGGIINSLKETGAKVKWVSAENIHLTLKFLGQTDDSLIEPIKDTITKKLLTYRPFYITIADVGCFPGMKNPRVVWAGIEKSEPLGVLQNDIDNEMVKFGYPLEKRGFSPHLTIGRVRKMEKISELTRKLDEFHSLCINGIEVSHITLMKSELSSQGARYYPLAEIPFGRRNNVE